MNNELPFVSSDISDSLYVASVRDPSKWCRVDRSFGLLHVPDMKEFLESIHGVLGDKYSTKFRQKYTEPKEYYFYFIHEDHNTIVMVQMEKIYPASYFSEEQIKEVEDVYQVSISGYAGKRTVVKLHDTVGVMPAYHFPNKEGVFDIDVIEKFMDGVEEKQIGHNLDTENFESVTGDMYPGIDMQRFLESYHDSNEKVMIFIGRPGTGKTSFLKLLLRETAFHLQSNISALYVKDVNLLHKASFWSFLTKAANDGIFTYLILDDLDKELLPRDQIDTGKSIPVVEDVKSTSEVLAEKKATLEVNAMHNQFTIVNKLLSLSDGLFSNNLKILITSNLESQNIDPAIIRPGRCFDVFKIPFMSVDEARSVWTGHFNLTEETFNVVFSDVLGKEGGVISQALLASEAEEVSRNRRKSDYLKDTSISVRDRFM